MNLAHYLEVQAGGPGSGRHPEGGSALRYHDYKGVPHALEHIRKLSESGGAHVALTVPFSKQFEVKSYFKPSAVPDHVIDLAIGDPKTNAVAYKGKLQGFTKAAHIREQNRGFGNK